MYIILCLCPCICFASTEQVLDVTSVLWSIPFCGILLSLALGPLICHHFWEKHYGKIVFGWCLAFFIPGLCTLEASQLFAHVSHQLITDYVPFILLIAALFITTGGINVRANWKGTPLSNVLILLSGTIAASWLGTTGASMVLIRPIIRANAWRSHSTHINIFFIFLVSNIGGALSPLGDPPLFLGFLQGVPFFWPTQALFIPTFSISLFLLGVFYSIDRYFYKKEQERPSIDSPSSLSLSGWLNICLLFCVIATVAVTGYWKTDTCYVILGNSVAFNDLVRNVILLIISLLSIYTTPSSTLRDNHFSWDPLLEVSKIFLGIFITVIPILALLQKGADGPFSYLLSLTSSANGKPLDIAYFWLTGILSSFLDNAPTYFIFFHMAGADVSNFMGPLSKTLVAISTASVFMGALTYIGNAPNFMVKAIAQQYGEKMPSFFGYIAWSAAVLIPTFLVFSLIFFH